MALGVAKQSRGQQGVAMQPALSRHSAATAMTSTAPRPNVQSVNGIEAQRELRYYTWTPGQEYVKAVVVKNVRYKALKISCEKHGRHFSARKRMRKVMVSPGTTVNIPVVFAPTEVVDYSDTITITADDGTALHVYLRADAPRPELKLPPVVDLGLLAVGSTANKVVPMQNTSKFTITWKLTAPPDFAIEPGFGVLLPGDTQAVSVSFSPTIADRYEGAVPIKFDADDGEHCGQTEMYVRGAAKYPHVSFEGGARQALMDFGQVRQGGTLERSAQLINHSAVDAPYVVRHSYLGDSCLALHGNTGTVPANGSITLTVVYTAGRLYHHCNEYLLFKFHAGTQLRLACKGDTVSPSILCKETRLDCGVVPTGSSTTQTVTLRNIADIPTRVSWPSADAAAFIVRRKGQAIAATSSRDEGRGAGGEDGGGGIAVIPELGSLELEVVFTPSSNVHYFQRVEVALEHHAPVVLHLTGRGRSGGQGMALATMDAHVYDAVTAREHSGFAHLPPSQLAGYIEAGLLERKDGMYVPVEMEASPSIDTPSQHHGEKDKERDKCGSSTGTGHETAPPAAGQELPERQFDLELTSLADPVVDFGACPAGSKKKVAGIAPRQLLVANNTRGAVEVVWPNLAADTSGLFSISPQTAVVPPQETMTFDVVFRPVHTGKEYTCTVEATVNFTESARAEEKGLMNLPWTLAAHVMGNTLESTAEVEQLPSFAVQPTALVLPPTSPGLASHDTIELANTSDVPVFVRLTPPAENEQMQLRPVTPRHLLLPRQSRLATVAASPIKGDLMEGILRCAMGDDIANVRVAVSSVTPLLGFETDMLYLGSVCVGHTQHRSVCLRNMCALLCYYEVAITTRNGGVVSLVSTGGALEPNDEQDVGLVVSASDSGYMEETITVRFGAAPGHFRHQLRLPVALTAELPVLEGGLRTENGPCIAHAPSYPGNTDDNNSSNDEQKRTRRGTAVGAAAIDSRMSLSFERPMAAAPTPPPLSSCTFDVGSLVVGETTRLEAVVTNVADVTAYVELEHNIGSIASLSTAQLTLPPRCQRRVWMEVTPRHEGEDMFTVTADFLDAGGVVLASQPVLCGIFRGIRAKLIVSDVRSTHAGPVLLRSQLKLDAINAALAPVGNRSPPATEFSLDLDARAHLAEDTVVELQLRNCSECTCKWHALLPRDRAWQEAGWASEEPALLASTGMRITSGGSGDGGDGGDEEPEDSDALFEVEPRQGQLAPNATCIVTLRYQHDQVGEHTVPLMFKQDLTPTVLRLNLCGQTLPAGLPHLLVHPSSVWEFRPVPIGMHQPPRQYMCLHNPSDVRAFFRVDVASLDAQTDDNFGFCVFSCDTLEGTAAPGESTHVSWLFQPIEAREYQVTVAVHVEDMEDGPLLVTLRGRGIDPRNSASGDKKAIGSSSSSSSSRSSIMSIANDSTGHDTARLAEYAEAGDALFALDDEQVGSREQTKGGVGGYGVGGGDDAVADGFGSLHGRRGQQQQQQRGREVALTQQFLLSGQPALVSNDVLDFGAVCLHAVTRRLLFLRSCTDHVVSFFFDLGELSGLCAIEPQQGLLHPGEVQVCKVTLAASGVAGRVDCDVRCTFRDHQGEQAYEQQLRANEDREREADQLFTYTDEFRIGRGRAGAVRVPRDKVPVENTPAACVDATSFSHKVLDPGLPPTLSNTLSKSLRDNRPPSGSTRLQPVVGARKVVVSDTDLRASKYHTLPPIKVKGQPSLRTPQAPAKPFDIFVRVRCQVMCKQDMPADCLSTLFVDHSAVEEEASASSSSMATLKAMTDVAADAKAVEDVMLLMLREATSDPTFVSALDKLPDEPCPCYLSLRTAAEGQRGGGGHHRATATAGHVKGKRTAAPGETAATEVAFVEQVLDETLCNLLLELNDAEGDKEGKGEESGEGQSGSQ